MTGDTVNVAARLEQAAPAGEILIGEPTYRLVRDAVEVEEVEPLELKGKSERVPAYRLLRVRARCRAARALEAPLVGREQELAALRGALTRRSRADRAALATVFGDAGVGKSRLTRELARAAGAAPGSCAGAASPTAADHLLAARRDRAARRRRSTRTTRPGSRATKLDALFPDALDVADRVASASVSDAAARARRCLLGNAQALRELAREQPLIVQIDDLHWAEDAFLG